MTTIINTPQPSNPDDSSVGVLIGIIIAVLIIGLFFVFGLPYLRNQAVTPTDSTNQPPKQAVSTDPTVKINVPANASY